MTIKKNKDSKTQQPIRELTSARQFVCEDTN